MLLQIILLVFALLGLAAAVVDLGFARAAQAEMQSGVDTAALETLRSRDSSGSDSSRHNARLYLWNTYVDPANERLVGAGADLTLTGGEPGRNGLQTISVGVDPVYRPCLALNVANRPNGDVVTGKVMPQGARAAEYADDYTRYLDAGAGKDSVLVRLRRTGYQPAGGPDTPEADPTCNSDETTVSAGPGVPLLFGLGTTIQSNAAGYSVRQHGVTVRATAVADSRPARRIAASSSAPFGVTRDFWEGSTTGEVYGMSIAASGVMSMSGTETGFLWSGGSVPVRIGATIPTGAGSGGTDGSYYVPIYNSYGGDRVVIGFGYAAVVYSLNGKTCWVSPVHRWMASAGASALAAEGIPGTATYVSFVSSQNASLQKALMAPALAR